MGFLAQYEEGRLKHVFRIVLILQCSHGDTHHHRPVPAHDCGERCLVAPAHETPQELLVRFRAKFHGAYDVAYAAKQVVFRSHLHW
jgi:hypothetical protein